MRIEIGRKVEKFVKSKINHMFINKDDFTIISNNCWGTFIYKKFGLPYKSPFVNLLVFAPDYIDLLENFSIDILEELSFIEHIDSKYKDELVRIGIYEEPYPIGILANKYELHFLHYASKEEAQHKWYRRIKRMNLNKLIFKFSDGDMFESDMAIRFNNLKFKNKVCFVSKEYAGVSSVVTLEKFKNNERVHDEWKNSKKEFNVIHFINNMKINEDV